MYRNRAVYERLHTGRGGRDLVNRDTGRIELVATDALYEYDICLSWCDLRVKLTHA